MHAGGIALAAVGGLVFGSFANVVVHRVPRNESIVRPGSRCPSCGAELQALDNVPLVSWIALRGRCRHCGARISARYPAIEALTGALWAIAAVRLPAGDLVAYLPLLWVLVVLAFIDLETKLLPNRIVYPATAASVVLFGIAASIGPGAGSFVRALLGAVAGFGFFLLLAIVSPAGMGMGDVKLAALLGMALGYQGWSRVFVGFFLSFILGAAGGIALMLAGKGGKKTQVPFGPYLALGTIVTLLFGAPIVRVWLGHS